MTANQRIQKIREHLEIAYGHEMFSVEEIENTEDKVEVKIEKYYQDKTYEKEIVFSKNEEIVGVKDKHL